MSSETLTLEKRKPEPKRNSDLPKVTKQVREEQTLVYKSEDSGFSALASNDDNNSS